ncbi:MULTISPECIES: helix-turn-helix domain-containing protein [unclassified Paenibacillus]|uniref:helix-turn-helix domain-containing protein n=1 Tax=unclassified Paenibacillus TaxID=185978 RepID=UPI0008C73C6B|nr:MULTISPECIES: helix-turn-helix domain-containing protein [unclassified Paenibacillus]SEO86703.1 transposase, IS30 family [Paenibacillus sp. OK076]
MSYTHLSIIERSKLEILRRQCQISRAIAKELGRHPSTICRELDPATSSKPYHAEQAKSAYEERRKASISLGKWSEAIRHD